MLEYLFGTDMPLALRFFLAFVLILIVPGLLIYLVARFLSQKADSQPRVRPGGGSPFQRTLRTLIVSTFEGICIALVVLPTILVLLAALAVAVENGPEAAETMLSVAVVTFLASAFLAGGALTLVTISDNTAEIVRVLHEIEKTQLRSIAEDVHRMEASARDVRNLEAVTSAVLPETPPTS
jgi:hypothetical protein